MRRPNPSWLRQRVRSLKKTAQLLPQAERRKPMPARVQPEIKALQAQSPLPLRSPRRSNTKGRHCETTCPTKSAGQRSNPPPVCELDRDCFVTSFLAMTSDYAPD